MRPKNDLSFDEASSLFTYDPYTGLLAWRNDVGRWGRIKAGTPAGSKCTTGHLQVNVNGRAMVVHRIAYTLIHGHPPTDLVDHINGDPSDNRAANLRHATKAMNCQNIRKPMKGGTSGFLGVTRNRKKWKCLIRVDGKQKYLGTYETAELAYSVYLKAKRELHEGCTI